MEIETFRFNVRAATAAWRDGLPITADTHLRHAISAANRLKRRDLTAALFRCRNRVRPAAMRALDALATDLGY